MYDYDKDRFRKTANPQASEGQDFSAAEKLALIACSILIAVGLAYMAWKSFDELHASFVVLRRIVKVTLFLIALVAVGVFGHSKLPAEQKMAGILSSLAVLIVTAPGLFEVLSEVLKQSFKLSL